MEFVLTPVLVVHIVMQQQTLVYRMLEAFPLTPPRLSDRTDHKLERTNEANFGNLRI